VRDAYAAERVGHTAIQGTVVEERSVLQSSRCTPALNDVFAFDDYLCLSPAISMAISRQMLEENQSLGVQNLPSSNQGECLVERKLDDLDVLALGLIAAA
jgi:hypothetical protein